MEGNKVWGVVPQNSYVVKEADDGLKGLVTFGLGPCVGVIIQEENNLLLGHMDSDVIGKDKLHGYTKKLFSKIFKEDELEKAQEECNNEFSKLVDKMCKEISIKDQLTVKFVLGEQNVNLKDPFEVANLCKYYSENKESAHKATLIQNVETKSKDQLWVDNKGKIVSQIVVQKVTDNVTSGEYKKVEKSRIVSTH